MPPLQNRCLHRHVPRYESNPTPELKWDELNASMRMFYGDNEDLYKEMQSRGESYNAMERRCPSYFARSWIPIIKHSRRAGAHTCTRQGVIGAVPGRNNPSHVVSYLWARLSQHTTVLWRNNCLLCHCVKHHLDVKLPPSSLECPLTQLSNDIIITTSETVASKSQL